MLFDPFCLIEWYGASRKNMEYLQLNLMYLIVFHFIHSISRRIWLCLIGIWWKNTRYIIERWGLKTVIFWPTQHNMTFLSQLDWLIQGVRLQLFMLLVEYYLFSNVSIIAVSWIKQGLHYPESVRLRQQQMDFIFCPCKGIVIVTLWCI